MITMNDFEYSMYMNWIAANIDSMEAIGGCTMFTRVMQQHFPELQRVEGYIRHKMTRWSDWSSGEYHEWLVTSDGTIIDPTRSQFDSLFGDNWEYIDFEKE